MRIVNTTIACSTEPRVKLRLKSLPNCVHYKKFPGVKIRFQGFTAMIFRSGKINLLGLKTLDRLDQIFCDIAVYLSRAGYDVKVQGCIKNIVITTTVDSGINLTASYNRFKAMGFKCMLELELYPALRVWNKWTALIYHSGTIIVTGVCEAQLAEITCKWLEATVCIAE